MGQEIESGLGIPRVVVSKKHIKIGQTELCKAATKKTGVFLKIDQPIFIIKHTVPLAVL
jgi:hypothetical protein